MCKGALVVIRAISPINIPKSYQIKRRAFRELNNKVKDAIDLLEKMFHYKLVGISWRCHELTQFVKYT